MYGLVNQAVKGLVTRDFGENAWAKMCAAAGTDGDFVAMQTYDDSVTYGLVAAGVDILGLDAETILGAFGKYWVLDVAAANYGDLMKGAGDNFADFLSNLDQLHSRVKLSHPNLNPPSFRCDKLDDGKLRLLYISHRAGLAPFVAGLLEGLAEFFNQELVKVDLVKPRGDNGHYDEFLIDVRPQN